MFGYVRLTCCKFPCAVFLSMSLLSCGGPSSWEDLAEIDTGSSKILAGNELRIEPSEFAAASIVGTAFSITKFNFNGTRKEGTGDLELLPTVTVMAGKGDFHAVETLSEKAIHWRAGEPQKAVTITYVNMPTGSAYSGKGHLYFYLTDPDKNCVSNIVAWPVEFTKKMD